METLTKILKAQEEISRIGEIVVQANTIDKEIRNTKVTTQLTQALSAILEVLGQFEEDF